MNPATMLDNLLDEYAPPAVRRYVHIVILLAGIVVTALMASNGDWKKAGVSLAVALYAAANKANTLSTSLDPAGYNDAPNDGQSYEQAGGQPFPDSHPEDFTPDATTDAAPAEPPVSGNLS